MRRESPGALKATWFRYVAVCISLSACLLLLQHLLQPAIDGQIWGMLLHNAHGDGPEIQRVHLDARWTTGRLSYPSGIFRNRLVLVQRSVVRSREPIHFGNKEWELRLRADGMDRVGPYRHDKGLTESVFALVLAPPGTDSIALQIDIAAPASGSVRRMIEREWIAAEALASSVGTGEADAGESTSSPVELTLRHSEGNLQVSIDGRLIGSVQLTYRFESAFLELRALPGSLVAFDDLAIGRCKTGSGLADRSGAGGGRRMVRSHSRHGSASAGLRPRGDPSRGPIDADRHAADSDAARGVAVALDSKRAPPSLRPRAFGDYDRLAIKNSFGVEHFAR